MQRRGARHRRKSLVVKSLEMRENRIGGSIDDCFASLKLRLRLDSLSHQLSLIGELEEDE